MYYFIPLIYKDILRFQIEQWIASAPNPEKAYVVVSPAKYDGATNIVVELESGINDMLGNPIMQYSIGQGNLLGFCLKGELDEPTHLFALSLAGVRAFDNGDDYLEFLKTV